MLRNLPEHIRACQVRAAECRERANQITDAKLKADFREMEQRWMHLARSYGFVESLQDFLIDAHRKASGEPAARLANTEPFGRD